MITPLASVVTVSERRVCRALGQHRSTQRRLPITSQNVRLSGNSNVMRITYTTELADYETYIPAADQAGVRDTTVFEEYGA
jgi:hypothetical protein